MNIASLLSKIARIPLPKEKKLPPPMLETLPEFQMQRIFKSMDEMLRFGKGFEFLVKLDVNGLSESDLDRILTEFVKRNGRVSSRAEEYMEKLKHVLFAISKDSLVTKPACGIIFQLRLTDSGRHGFLPNIDVAYFLDTCIYSDSAFRTIRAAHAFVTKKDALPDLVISLTRIRSGNVPAEEICNMLKGVAIHAGTSISLKKAAEAAKIFMNNQYGKEACFAIKETAFWTKDSKAVITVIGTLTTLKDSSLLLPASIAIAECALEFQHYVESLNECQKWLREAGVKIDA